MQTNAIATEFDLRRIEREPYASFLSPTHLAQALELAAARHGARPALSFIEAAEVDAPVRRWTHAELLADVRRAANLFHRLGRGAPRVAMLLPAIPEAYLTLLGAELAGVVCPINHLLQPEHVAELLRACRANVVVTLGPHPELDLWPRVPALRAACPELAHVLSVGGPDDFTAALAREPADRLAFEREVGRDTLAALFHTGGTTGAPKLAQHTHGNQLHASWGAAQMYAMTEGDVILSGFPLFHVAGAFVYGPSALLSGAQVVLPTLQGLRNPAFVARYWRFVERHRVTLLAAVPTVIATLEALPRDGADVSSVRALLTGGSPLPEELAAAFERRHGIPVRNIFGMTECAGIVSVEPMRAPHSPGSCGLPLPFSEVQAVDAAGRACAAGVTGVLRLRGPNVGPGYTDGRRNAGTFTDDGWLITGDLGHVDADGRVHVTGRAKDVIIRGGHNIDPGAVEEALLRHPDVQMAAVVGAPDEYAGELPVAFVVARPGAVLDAQAVLAAALPHIAERPAVPKRIEVVAGLPLTAIGKVYKPALRARAAQSMQTERLQRAGVADAVTVQVEDRPQGLYARFDLVAGAGDAVRAAVRAVMQPLALAYGLHEHDAMGTR